MNDYRGSKKRGSSGNNRNIRNMKNSVDSFGKIKSLKLSDGNLENSDDSAKKEAFQSQYSNNVRYGRNNYKHTDTRGKAQNKIDNRKQNSSSVLSENERRFNINSGKAEAYNNSDTLKSRKSMSNNRTADNKSRKSFGENNRRGHREETDNIKIGGGYVRFSEAENHFDKLNVGEAYNENSGFAEQEENYSEGIVAGRNAVRELLRSERSVDKIYVSQGKREGSIVVIVAEAAARHIPIVEVSDSKLDVLSGGIVHQGVVAYAASKQYCSVEDILKKAQDQGEAPFIVIADGIEDPHNLGALIRCAECAGVHGMIIPKRRAVGITPVVTKSSAGAIEHMLIAKVQNIASTVDFLKKEGVWIYAADAAGEPYYNIDYSGGAAFVFGSEGDGVSRLIMDKSDFHVAIPMYGHVNSLNVSTAASVVLCNAAKVRHGL